MVQDNIPAAGYTLLSELDDLTWDSWLSLADVATAMNTKAASQGAIFANSFTNTYLKYSGIALVFNHANLTAANAAAIFNEAGFVVANKALVFREAGLSIANINAIIIHANITDDNAQQILSEITKANRDLTSADNIYEILDDWNDNKLTARDGAGTTSTGFTNTFAQKDMFRPEWTVSANVSAAGGKLVFSATAAIKTAEIASTFVTGTWEVDAVRGTSYNGWLGCKIIDDGTDYYALYADGNSTAYHLNRNATHLITGTWTNDAATHTFKTTRDGSGNFEIFEDGISKGTVTNTDTTTSVKQIITNAASTGGSTDTYDNYKVY